MKVLLTGANGFVGSHILDRLARQQIPTVALLRANSDRAWPSGHSAQVEVRTARVTLLLPLGNWCYRKIGEPQTARS